MNNESIAAAYESTRVFNDVAENLVDVDEDSVDNQLYFIFEEMTETITAFEEQDSAGLLDGACDLFVTVAGLMQKLEAAGFNVQEALLRVVQNNLDKFPSGDEPITYSDKLTATLNKEHNVYVLKNEIGKICKPKGFVSVALDDLVPDHFFGEVC